MFQVRLLASSLPFLQQQQTPCKGRLLPGFSVFPPGWPLGGGGLGRELWCPSAAGAGFRKEREEDCQLVEGTKKRRAECTSKGHCLVGHKRRVRRELWATVPPKRVAGKHFSAVGVTVPEQETGPDRKVGMTLLMSVL